MDGTHRWNGGRNGRPLCVIVFCARFLILHSPLISKLDIVVAIRNFVMVQEKLDQRSIIIYGHTFYLTLILIGIKIFDVVLGMDLLSANRAKILCFEKFVRIKLSKGGNIIARGQKSLGSMPIISMMKAHKFLAKGCEVLLGS